MGTKVKLKKSLVIQIEGGQPGGPHEAIIFYGQPDRPTVVRCTVRFTTNYECKGDCIELCFTGRAVSSWSEGEDSRSGRDVFHRQVWELPVNHPRPSRIAPGSYQASFDAILSPTSPSTSETNGGRVTYLVEAKLRRSWSLNLVELQRIWYSATSLPPASVDPIVTVGSCSGVWRDTLPYSIIIPSEILCLGQLVPVTFRLGPLLVSSPMAGQPIRLIGPKLRLKQYAHVATSSGNSTAVRKKVVVDLVLAHWPKNLVFEYQDTVLAQLPTLPDLAPTTETSVYSVRHSLNLAVGIGMNGMVGVMKVKVKVNITGPRPPAEYPGAQQAQGKLEGVHEVNCTRKTKDKTQVSCAADKRVSVIDRTLTGTDPTRTETHLGVAGAKKLQEQKVVTEALSQSVKKTAEEAATAAVLALQAVPMSRALKSSLGNTLGEPKTLYSPKDPAHFYRRMTTFEQESDMVVLNTRTHFLGLLAACKLNSQWERHFGPTAPSMDLPLWWNSGLIRNKDSNNR
ncbi:hypothetical protein BG003_010997 [Podila horticola]|nr:hypothetical protein BG003_010997 [Podila horticola]